MALSDLIVSVNKMNKWAAVSACISSLQVPLSWPVACIIISTKKKKRAKSALPSGQMPSMPDYQFSSRWDESQHI